MKIGDLVKHGWTEGKHGLITDIIDRTHSCAPGENIRIYDIPLCAYTIYVRIYVYNMTYVRTYTVRISYATVCTVCTVHQ